MFLNTALLTNAKLVNLTIDPFDQAAYLFSSPRWEGHDEVIAIAVAGDRWSYTTVSRGGIKPHRDENDDPVWGNSPENLGVNLNTMRTVGARFCDTGRHSPRPKRLKYIVTKALQLLEDCWGDLGININRTKHCWPAFDPSPIHLILTPFVSNSSSTVDTAYCCSFCFHIFAPRPLSSF